MTYWDEIDRILKIASPFILTEDERQHIARLEQSAYESNMERIRKILEVHKLGLEQRQFWTELTITNSGLRFRYSYPGFYGPGGFSSQYHIAGPLVLGSIEPKGNEFASFYPNNIGDNTFLGEQFDEIAFERFVVTNLLKYLAPENQILSSDQYKWIRSLIRP